MNERLDLNHDIKETINSYNALLVAQDLYKRFGQEIRLSEARPIDDEAKFNPEKAILNFLGKVSGETLSRYQGHGITRGDDITRLAALIHICGTNLLKGDWGSMGNGSYSSYKHGPAIVLSKIDKSLYSPEERNPRHISNEDGDFIEVNIGAVIIAPKWYPIIDNLKQMFPNITFVRANQIPEYFQNNK